MNRCSNPNRRPQRTGFTLIELLVVIAIIALLLSVITPALNLAKDKAREVICRSNLKEWGYMFSMYAQSNDDNLMGPEGGLWVDPLRPYYGEGNTDKIRMCPMTSLTKTDPFLQAWEQSADGGLIEEDYASSYGINNWVYNTPPSWDKLWGYPTANNWRKTTVDSTYNIPLFLECFRWGAHPESNDRPPQSRPETMDELKAAGTHLNQINRFNLDRHRGKCNVLFLDAHVEGVTLRGLWGLKWHQAYKPGAEVERMNQVGWPDWMKK